MLRLRAFCYLAILLLTSACVATARADVLHRLEGQVIVPVETFPGSPKLEPSTRVLLNGGERSALVKQDGQFTVENLPEGTYLLEVSSHKFMFPKLRVQVDATGVKSYVAILGTEWNAVQTNLLPYPLEIKARSLSDYFAVRESFSIASLFMNPYMIMMGFSVIMLIVLPKMMANLDPEALKEIQEQQAQNPIEMPDLSSKLANYMAGTGDKNRKG